jgi:p-aminobenzoyl-glutamate transporter AbgT
MILPAMVVGLGAWLALGGSETWESWQYGTCYVIPGALILSSFIVGFMGSGESDT